MRYRLALHLTALALAALAAACSSTSTNEAGGTGGAAGAGGCANSGSVCKSDTSGCCACGQSKCAAQNQACLCNTDCAATLICALKCPTASCVDTCNAEHPDGGFEFDNLRNCAAANCGDVCPL